MNTTKATKCHRSKQRALKIPRPMYSIAGNKIKSRGCRKHKTTISHNMLNFLRQRAFRARRERCISDIHQQIENRQMEQESLEEENRQLLSRVRRLRLQNDIMRRRRYLSYERAGEPTRSVGKGKDDTVESHANYKKVTDDSEEVEEKRSEFSDISQDSSTLAVEAAAAVYDEFLPICKTIAQRPDVMSGRVSLNSVIEQLLMLILNEPSELIDKEKRR